MNAKNKKTINKNNKKVSKITLATHQDISVINKLYGRLKKCADRQVDVNIDCTNVETIDVSTLQLLLSFSRKIRSHNNALNWHAPTQAIVNTARIIGVEKELIQLEQTE